MSMPMPTQPNIKTGKFTGKVIAIDRESLTVETQRKGQAESHTLRLTDQTKTKGEVSVGSEVKVNYREETSGQIATSVQAKKQK